MINNHVVSLDLAKQLYEAGIKIESEFVWFLDNDGEWKIISEEDLPSNEVENDSVGVYLAPLASELGQLLPGSIGNQFPSQRLTSQLGMSGWLVYYDGNPKLQNFYKACVQADTMPDAMAKMAIYLKEKGFL